MASLASIIQGEAGTYQGQLAVANVINNRAAIDFNGFGYSPFAQANAPGQFIGSQSPGPNATGIASLLQSGSLGADNTGGALYYVSRAPGLSWGGVQGASGPVTAAIISGGNNIGGNYFSDQWGAPSDAFNQSFAAAQGGVPTPPANPFAGSSPYGTLTPISPTDGSVSGSSGTLFQQADPTGIGAMNGSPVPLTINPDGTGGSLPTFAQGAATPVGSLVSGLWEQVGATAVTTAGKEESQAIAQAGNTQAKAVQQAAQSINQAATANTKSLTTTSTGIASAAISDIFNLFERGGVLVMGLIFLAGALFILAFGSNTSVPVKAG